MNRDIVISRSLHEGQAPSMEYFLLECVGRLPENIETAPIVAPAPVQVQRHVATKADAADVASDAVSTAPSEAAADIMQDSAFTSMFMIPDSDDDEPAFELGGGWKPSFPDSVRLTMQEIADGKWELNHNVGVLTQEFWANTCRDIRASTSPKSCTDEGPAYAPSSAVQRPSYTACVQQDGFICAPPATATTSNLAVHIARIVRQLESLGWPPIFAFMFDETWQLVDKLFDVMELVLGKDCVMEASIFLWSLRRNAPVAPTKQPADELKTSVRPQQKYIGGNFGLPHRDYPYNECFTAAGEPHLMNVWVPLTDATLDNGCMYVLPREFDPLFDQPDHPNHLKCATPGQSTDENKIRFVLGGARPLPAPAGSCLSWPGNLIHWGSACASTAETPRISFAVAFRRAQGMRSHLEDDMPCMTRTEVRDVPLHKRLRLIAKGLLLFQWWYPLDNDSIPAAFLETLQQLHGLQ